MASTSFLFATCLLLSCLLVIASAGDYGYGYSPKPDTIKPESGYSPKPKVDDKPNPESNKPQYEHGPKPKVDDKPNPESPKHQHGYGPKPKVDDQLKGESSKPNYGYGPKSEVENPKPESPKFDNGYSPKAEVEKAKPETPKSDNSYGLKPNPDTTKPETVKPDYGYTPKPNLDKPKVTSLKPEHGTYAPKPEAPLPIAIQGLVLCKSGSNYVPIEGALARIVCSGVDENGYETTAVSCMTGATDAKGYFYKALPDLDNEKLKITECKAFLESSPLETCKVPTDVNKGISGALLSSYRILKDKKVKLYSVGPFLFTSNAESAPSSAPRGY